MTIHFYLRSVFIVVAVLFLSACSQTPLQKLASDQLYPELNSAYWAKEHNGQTALWKDAVSYCEQNAGKPNCSAVMEVYVIMNGSTQAPAIGHSGQVIHLPE